ncbi:MAG: hypothetical protein ACLFPL_05605 [Candidatus Nanoarchaeia archaeon]
MIDTKDIMNKVYEKNKELFINENVSTDYLKSAVSDNIRYDLIGKLVLNTNLTRKTLIKILNSIEEDKFTYINQTQKIL